MTRTVVILRSLVTSLSLRVLICKMGITKSLKSFLKEGRERDIMTQDTACKVTCVLEACAFLTLPDWFPEESRFWD